MPLSKRLKDCMQSFLLLQAELQISQKQALTAQLAHAKAKKLLEDKVGEILKELTSCLPASPELPQERVIEVEGKTYLICENPKDINTSIPTYIREIKVER